MKISTIAIGLMVLIAASTLALAQGPSDDKGRPDMDANIEIVYDTVSYMFFSEEDVDTWEITVTWKEGNPDGTGYIELDETYKGTIVYDNGNSPAYNVQFIPGTASDEGGDVTTPITIKADGDLLYPVTATANTADGDTITVSGILDLNPIVVD
jgi:hypothetical protein